MRKSREHSYRFGNYQELREHFFLKNANNLASCSCWMCQNPRKWMKHKTTMQEDISLINQQEEMQINETE